MICIFKSNPFFSLLKYLDVLKNNFWLPYNRKASCKLSVPLDTSYATDDSVDCLVGLTHKLHLLLACLDW